MILTGKEIERRVGLGEIEISPFRPEQVCPASYDVRLGSRVLEYAQQSGRASSQLDSRNVQLTVEREIPESGIWIYPGRLYLLHTEEVVCAPNLVAVVDGKSSIGRLGVVVHVTAGYVDPGFHGQLTLEVASLAHPVRLYVGQLVAQLRFHELAGEVTSYQAKGSYTGEASMGPVASRSWRQFG